MATTINQQLVEAIHAELLARVTGASIPDYSMPDGRSVRKIESSELRQLLENLRALAQQETTSANGTSSMRAYATFGRPR